MVTVTVLFSTVCWMENRSESGQQFPDAQKSTTNASWNRYEKQESPADRFSPCPVHPGI